MNHAYIDASWQEQPGGLGLDSSGLDSLGLDNLGLGGWGLVLLRPGHLPLRVQGGLQAPDNNAAELRAALEALRVAPAGEALTIYTDNQAVVACLARGRGPEPLRQQAGQILAEAGAREVRLLVQATRRTARHLRAAHELANAARLGVSEPAGWAGVAPKSSVWAEVLLEHRPALNEARISLRRAGSGGQAERVTLHLPTDPRSEVPPSLQVLLAAVGLARPGESVQVRRASKVAQAMWQDPRRALRPGVQQQLQQARAQAEAQGVQVAFEGQPFRVE